MKFAFQNLEVWVKAVGFAIEVLEMVENFDSTRKHYRLFEQIEASSTSIPMNIAEGKGRYSKKEFIHYLYISRGSLYETMTLLEIFHRKEWISNTQLSHFEKEGVEIAAMIKGLINAIRRGAESQRPSFEP